MNGHILYNQKAVHFGDEGTGNVLVLLHGFTESLTIWKQFSAELSKDFRVITIDLPGHGKTEVFSNSHSMAFMADVVDAVLEYLQINSCVMVGHSMGGYVTLAYLNKYSKKIKGFGLFHSQAAADSEEARNNRERTIKVIEHNRAGFIMNFIPELFAPANIPLYQKEIKLLQKEALIPPPEGITAALRGMMLREDFTSLLANTDKPVFLIAGKEDSKIPVDDLLKQAALTNHAEVLILGNTGHMGFIEAAQETMGFIRDFARKRFGNR